MSDGPDSLILALLRRIDTSQGEMRQDIREIKERLGFLEGSYASLSRRVDRIELRLERIEQRLDLVPAP